MTTTEHIPSLTAFTSNLLADSAPRGKRQLMRDRVRIGQRWKRRATGEVIVIHQVHRADRQVEAVYEQPRLSIDFADLRDRYEEIGR